MHHGHRGVMMPIPTCRRRRPANLVTSDWIGEHRSLRRRVVAKKEGDRTALRSVAAAAGRMVLPIPTLRRSMMKAIHPRMLARNRRDGHRTSTCDSQKSRHGDEGASTARVGKADCGRVKSNRGRWKICRGRDMTCRDRDPDSMMHHNCEALVAALVIETYCGDSRRLGVDRRRACPARVVTTCGG